jgi:oxygen-independent coproporphyrinogen III oxidase
MPGAPLKLDQRVPRYTSYPTAPHFGTGVDHAVYGNWIRELPAGTSVSAYVHVPFCASLCWYCGCHTTVTHRDAPIAEYARLVEREIALVGEHADSLELSAVHWGGGTPNMLAGRDMAALTTALSKHFRLAADVEIAAELDPRLLTQAKVAAFADIGLSRASLGVQDFDHRVQTAINRLQPYAMVRDAVTWLRAAGLRSISLDLMYGLPYQTVTSVLETVDRAISLEPDRISLFGYAHVPWLKKHQLLIPEDALPSPDDRFAQSEAAADRLMEHGYRRIGIDHFARPGDLMAQRMAEGRLRRNFQGYTTDEASALLGFGESAISTLPQGYAQNVSNLPAYRSRIQAGLLATTRGIALSPEDRLRRDVIETLMCGFEVDLAAVAKRHGLTPEVFDAALPQLGELEKQGVLRRSGWRVWVTPKGRPLVRAVCAIFDTYLQRGTARHSAAV